MLNIDVVAAAAGERTRRLREEAPGRRRRSPSPRRRRSGARWSVAEAVRWGRRWTTAGHAAGPAACT